MSEQATIREHLNKSFDLSVDYHKLNRDHLIVLARQMQDHAVAALAKVEAIEQRIRAIAEHNSCYFVDPTRTRPWDPCKRTDEAYCDQCAVRWDMEAMLADLATDAGSSLPGAPTNETESP